MDPHQHAVRPAEPPGTIFPPPALAQIYIDFDGTLSQADVLDHLITRYSINQDWRRLESDWEAGRIGSRECLAGQLAAVRVSHADLHGFLDSVRLDVGAADLLQFLRSHRIPVVVLSDGIDQFISAILHRHGIRDLTVRSNALHVLGGSLTLHCPHASPDCSSRSAHCKCASAAALQQGQRKTVYIGDGRSDLCAARRADVVFAKRALARCLTAEGRPFYPFETLADVRAVLLAAWEPKPTRNASIAAAPSSK